MVDCHGKEEVLKWVKRCYFTGKNTQLTSSLIRAHVLLSAVTRTCQPASCSYGKSPLTHPCHNQNERLQNDELHKRMSRPPQAKAKRTLPNVPNPLARCRRALRMPRLQTPTTGPSPQLPALPRDVALPCLPGTNHTQRPCRSPGTTRRAAGVGGT